MHTNTTRGPSDRPRDVLVPAIGGPAHGLRFRTRPDTRAVSVSTAVDDDRIDHKTAATYTLRRTTGPPLVPLIAVYDGPDPRSDRFR